MMIIDYLTSFAGNSAGVIALALYIAGVLVLLHSMRLQDRHTSGQAEIIAKLREHLGHSVKSQVELHDHVNLLHERYTELLSRQQRVETRAPDSRRIDTAMRMLKRGNGDAQTLLDLGLSNGEVKLLLRLHGKPTQIMKPTPHPDMEKTRVSGGPSPASHLDSATDHINDHAPGHAAGLAAGYATRDAPGLAAGCATRNAPGRTASPATVHTLRQHPVAAQGRALAQLLKA